MDQMRSIQLRGKHAVGPFAVAVVDDDAPQWIFDVKWKATPLLSGQRSYAVRNVRVNGKHKTQYLHREVLSYSGRGDVDHVDHNPMNNVRANLRIVDRSTNLRNWLPTAHAGTCKHCGVPFVRMTKSNVAGPTGGVILYCSDSCQAKRAYLRRRTSASATNIAGPSA